MQKSEALGNPVQKHPNKTIPNQRVSHSITCKTLEQPYYNQTFPKNLLAAVKTPIMLPKRVALWERPRLQLEINVMPGRKIASNSNQMEGNVMIKEVAIVEFPMPIRKELLEAEEDVVNKISEKRPLMS